MMKYFLLLLLFFCQLSFAEESRVALEKVSINLHDKKAIERGGKFFATTCMVCHTMVYLRYNELAKKAGVVYERMPINIKKWPNDVKPPDLSLIASRRGADWLYTYLHSFYLDSSRPTGANNLVLPNSAMPYVIAAFQGQQALIPENQLIKRKFGLENQWYDLLESKSSGTMTPGEFDDTMQDLVTFLVYASEPYRATQESIGFWVIVFLLVFFILTYLLKREYWKDVKH